MPEMKGYDHGVPSWVDLGSKDLAASSAFYGALFGWEAQVTPDPAAGGYTMLTSNGKMVAGLGPIMMDGQPEVWSTYVNVTEADATTKAVEAAGGMVLAPPMDVMDVGRMAVFMDDGGAAISVWQAKAHIGAELVNEPVSLTWNELQSRDIEKSKAFYANVFGWEAETNDMGGMTYTEFKVGGKSIAGMMEMGPQMPAEVPPHWLAYFAVADTDATVAKATELGGAVHAPAMTIPIGRFAVLADPRGASFGVMQLASES